MGALSALLLATLLQNRDLPQRLRDTGRAPPAVLASALRLWSPLAFAIVLLVLLAQGVSSATLAIAERATPLDAWCRFEGSGDGRVVPCTGQADRTGANELVQATVAERARHFAIERYVAALDHIGGLSAEERSSRLRDASPGAILGLPPSPEDDPELLRMRRELRQLLDTPVAPATSVLDALRVRGENQIRDRRLVELTGQVNARREKLASDAYAGRSSAEQARLWWQHHLSHRLEAGALPVVELQDIARRSGLDPVDALPVKLAEDAAWTREVIDAESAQPKTRAGLGIALALPRLCAFRSRPAETFDCPRLPGGTSGLRLRKVDLDEALPLSIDRWHAQRWRDGLLQLGRSARAVRAGRLAADVAMRDWERSLPSRVRLARGECGWSRPGDCADDMARRIAEQALLSAARQAGAPALAAGMKAREATQDFEGRLAQAVPALDAWIERSRVEARGDALWLLRIHALARTAGWLLLTFIAAKSFLYVLGLVVFRHGGPAVLGFADAPAVQGRLRMGRRLALDADFRLPLVTRRQLSNSDNHLRLAPWPRSSPIARLLRGRYLWFTRGRFLADAMSTESDARIASAEAGKAIVEWRMLPGEEVVFAWRDFFGASENLRFRTRVSLRLSTLLLGRIVFRVACCPAGEPGACLLLKADVEEGDPARLHAVPPERLLAWNRQLRFRAHGADTAWGVLVHGYTLVRDPASSGLVLATSAEGGPRFGSLRFLRRMFTAIF